MTILTRMRRKKHTVKLPIFLEIINKILSVFFPFKVNPFISLGLDTITKTTVDKDQTTLFAHDQASHVQPMPTDTRNPADRE